MTCTFTWIHIRCTPIKYVRSNRHMTTHDTYIERTWAFGRPHKYTWHVEGQPGYVRTKRVRSDRHTTTHDTYSNKTGTFGQAHDTYSNKTYTFGQAHDTYSSKTCTFGQAHVYSALNLRFKLDFRGRMTACHNREKFLCIYLVSSSQHLLKRLWHNDGIIGLIGLKKQLFQKWYFTGYVSIYNLYIQCSVEWTNGVARKSSVLSCRTLVQFAHPELL